MDKFLLQEGYYYTRVGSNCLEARYPVRNRGSGYRDNIPAIIVIMIRTQISLSEEEYNSAKSEAARLGISLAEFLRRSLRHVLPADESRPWMRYAGMIDTGERDASQKIDQIVYGQKK